MTDIARLTRAELRKLGTTYMFAVALAIAVALDVVSVVVDAAVAGKNGTPPLGTTASTDQMLKLGAVCCVAMLVVGIVAAGGEYRHRTIISRASESADSTRSFAPTRSPSRRRGTADTVKAQPTTSTSLAAVPMRRLSSLSAAQAS